MSGYPNGGSRACGVLLALLANATAIAETISGRVVSEEDGQAIAGIVVSANQWAGSNLQGLGSAVSDASGDYTILNLPPGDYLLLARAPGTGAGWLNERWPDVRCSVIDRPECLPIGLTQLTLAAGQALTGFHFSLERGYGFTGMFLPASGSPAGLSLFVHAAVDAAPAPAAQEFFGSSFTSVPLPAGTYRVVGGNSNGGLQRWQAWRQRNCATTQLDSCDLFLAQPITLGPQQSASVTFDFSVIMIDGFEDVAGSAPGQ